MEPLNHATETESTCSGSKLPNDKEHRIAIRGFVCLCALVIAIDTTPANIEFLNPIKKSLFPVLGSIGLSQGDWPLFAPNPILKNGTIVAEVTDGDRQQGTWSSPDWARATAWDKFYRFRHMNYYQRVGQNHYACSDLAAYLHRTIPAKEHAVPAMRWSEANELIPGIDLVPPMLDIKLYQYQQRMVLSGKNPMPKQSETVWSNQNRFLLRREYSK